MTKIFIVEDEAIIRYDIRRTLERLGYDVVGTAQSAVEAIVAIEELRPDLVLMDIQLGGRIDGISATATIRKRLGVPVIYLTAHSDEATLARAKETGPHGYLIKPFNERDLRTAIEVGLRKHELEQQLAQRERWFSTTLASIGDAIIATDADERITFLNAVAEKITGYNNADACGKHVSEILKLVDNRGKALDPPSASAIRDVFSVELPQVTRLVDRDGTSKEVADSISPILDDQGNMLGSIVVFRDVTEHRRITERLAAAERLASFSTMAAGMAHEINNPLAAMLANVEYAFKALQEAPSAHSNDPKSIAIERALEALTDASAAGVRIRRLVQDLKKFSRADDLPQEVVDLPDILEAALKLSRHEFGSSTSVFQKLGTTPLVSANEAQLVQVFANLMINAAHATRDIHGRPTRIEICSRTDEAGFAIVEIKDDGSGIAPDVLTKIFNPFFTTKPVGTGLGLGLSICKTLIEGLDGEISADSQPGHGATFRVLLQPAKGELRRISRSAPPPPTRRGRVLLIDDDEAIRRVITRMLRDHHDVFVESDGRAGLERLSRGETFDVVFCDLGMPFVSGVEFYEAAQTIDPNLTRRVVFLCGGVMTDRASLFLASCPNQILAKPFSHNEILAVVAGHVVQN